MIIFTTYFNPKVLENFCNVISYKHDYVSLFMNATRASTTVSNVSTPGTSLVEVEQLHVRFGKQEVLRSISLSIPTGQTLVIIGESGCGKTVLLKSIIGLVQPTDGIVRFAGRSLAASDKRYLRIAENGSVDARLFIAIDRHE